MPSLEEITLLSSSQSTLKNGSKPIGTPRLDKYDRLIKRLFEPLILLHTLGPIRGDHPPERQDTSLTGIRRQFLDDLAFLCEYIKGGEACTAIGIEDLPECFLYWVAANTDPAKKIVPFLRSILTRLRDFLRLTNTERLAMTESFTAEFTSYCIAHSRAKVKKLKSCLIKHSSACIERLEKDWNSMPDLELLQWLREFANTTDPDALCRLAYDTRHSASRRQLELWSGELPDQESPTGRRSDFAQARHYIGRLANHIRVPQRLIVNLPQVQNLVDNNVSVAAIPVVQCVPRPVPDNHTTLEGICNRMLPAGPKRTAVIEALEEMDRMHHILDNILKQYNDEKFVPRVHAEIQVLEHFHGGRREWAYQDRYVSCSKLACFCCHLYFRHHPANPVEPQSHYKIWLNWGPPLLLGRHQDIRYVSQWDILNKVNESIRADALKQIEERAGPHRWHPDSRTGITNTTMNPTIPQWLLMAQ